MTEAQKKAKTKYDASNTRTYSLKLNKNTDADIITFLDASKNVQGCIKEVIRTYTGKGGTNGRADQDRRIY